MKSSEANEGLEKPRDSRGTVESSLRGLRPRVFALCQRVLRRPEDAEDATQQVLLKVADRLARSSETDPTDGWLYRVALTTSLEHRRKQHRRAGHEQRSAESVDRSGSPEEDRVMDGLHQAIADLDDELRACVVGHYFEERSLGELAEVRGCSRVAVWKKLRKAHRELKEALRNAGYGAAIPFGSLDGLLHAKGAGAGGVLATYGKLFGGIAMALKGGGWALGLAASVAFLFLASVAGFLIADRRARAEEQALRETLARTTQKLTQAERERDRLLERSPVEASPGRGKRTSDTEGRKAEATGEPGKPPSRVQSLRIGIRGLLDMRPLDPRYGRGKRSPEESRRWSAAVADYLKLLSDPELDVRNVAGRLSHEEYTLAVLEELGVTRNQGDLETAKSLARTLAEKVGRSAGKGLLPGEQDLQGRRAIEEFMTNVDAAFPGSSSQTTADVVYALSGGYDDGPGVIASLSESREQVIDSILNSWDPKKTLTVQERLVATSVASAYLQTYVDLRAQASSQYDPAFVDTYFFRGATEDSAEGIYHQIGQWPTSNPGYAWNAWRLDTRFREVASAAQKDLAAVLPPDKQGIVSAMPLGVRHFPGVR